MLTIFYHTATKKSIRQKYNSYLTHKPQKVYYTINKEQTVMPTPNYNNIAVISVNSNFLLRIKFSSLRYHLQSGWGQVGVKPYFVKIIKNPKTAMFRDFFWLRRLDLNQRPSGYEQPILCFTECH